WIPPFAGKPAPSESGHRNYQRSGRPWGQWMDTFPALVIYTSLLALSKDTRLWGSLNNEQNLLFSLEDFEPPYQTEVWQRLEAVGDRELSSAAARLKEYCAPGLSPSGALEGLLERPWWERTRGAAPAPEGRAGQTQRPRRPAEPDDPSLPPPKKIEPSPAPPTAPIPPPPADAPWWPTEARTPAGSPPTGEPSWWAGSQQPKPQAPPGPVSPGKPGKPPGRRSARRRWVIALVLIILALIVVFVVIPRIIVPLVIQSSFYRANAPHPTSQYTATQMFGTVLNGTCEQRTDRITSYDSELLGCSSSRYTRFFVKYSGTNPAGWADVAKKGYSTFVLKQADSCRDTYEATFTANVPRNAVIYVYRSTPFVAGIAADASDADLAAVRGATYYYLTDPGNSGSATLATSSC
ncbi:MAG TPA: hypothetical protein VFO16_22380, partial [Pseudonocardiaceae bacterium]|nr:hypothetical protein [Pseudonocardiaceae bacterium]